MDAKTLEHELSGFVGTESYHRWNVLCPNFYLTDGTKYLADKAGCYWLMDLVASYQRQLLQRGEHFQVWKLKVNPDASAIVRCEDGNNHKVLQQSIPFTDFPAPGIEVWAEWSSEGLVIYLPSEH